MKAKRLFFTLAILATGTGLSVAENDKPEGVKPAPEKPERPRPPGGGGGGRPGAPGEMLKQLDADGNGAISEAEAGERWERMARLDSNGDKEISKEEFAAMAGRPGGPQGSGGPAGGPRGGGQFFENADKNGDGKLTKDEVPEQGWARMSEADKDGDQAVTKEELAAHFRERAGGMRPGGPDSPGGGRLFEMADKNKDGKLTAEEMGERWERMSQLDKNGDGAITREELPQMGQGRGDSGGPGKSGGRPGGEGGGQSTAIFDRYDKDGDQKLSKDEVSEEMWARLGKADKNADGLVSKEELGAVFSNERRGGGEGKPGTGREGKRPKAEGSKGPKEPKPGEV